jgi:hypothetical protein
VGGSTSLGTIPVIPGYTYTGFCQVIGAAGVTFDRQATIYWWTAAGNVAASTANTTGTRAVVTTSWQRYAATGVAPANAAYASFVPIRIAGGGAGQVEYYDGHSFHVGAGGLWVAPGVPVPNLGIRANPADATQAQVWNPGNATWITV